MLNNLGLAYADLGEPRRAIELFEQWLAIARELGERRGEACALGNLGLALDQLGERPEAIARMRAALLIFDQIEAGPFAQQARTTLAAWGAEEPG